MNTLCPIILNPNKDIQISTLSYTTEEILEKVQIIWDWCSAWNRRGSLVKHIELAYGFGPLYEFTGGKVEDDNTYTYPRDPALQPLAIISCKVNARVICYEYAMIAIIQGDAEPFVTRVD